MSEKPTYEELEQRIQALEKIAAEFKKKEDGFKQIRIELDALFNNAPLVMFIVDRDRRLCKLNEAAVVMTRRAQDRSIGLRGGEALRCVNAFDDPRGCGYSDACESCIVRNTVLDTFRTGQDFQSVEAQIPYAAESGTVVLHVLVSTTLLKSPDKERVLVCLNDITNIKQVESALVESEKRYRSIFENIQDVYAEVAADGTIIEVSPSITRISGYTREEVIGRSFADFYVDPAKLTALWDRLRRQGRVNDYEVRLHHKDGSVRIFSYSVKALTDASGLVEKIVGTMRDITDRKQAEKALQESEAKLRGIFENKGTATGVFGQDSIIRECNAVFEELSGYSRSEIIDKMKWSDFVVKEDLERMYQYHVQRSKNGASPPSQYECGIINKKGEIRNVIVNISLVDKMRIASLVDITARKKMEEALISSEDKFRSLANNINIGVYRNTAGDKGKFIEANPAIVEMFGHASKEEFLKLKVSDLYKNPYARRAFNAELIQKGSIRNKEIELQKKDGTFFIGSVSAVAVKGENGDIKYFDGIIEDVTKRKQEEEERAVSMRRYQALLDLNQMTAATLPEITDFALEAAVRLTGSKIGYLAFLNADESVLTMHSWSQSAMKECAVANKPIRYPVVNTGLWGEAVRQRKPIITNDYSAASPLKKGLPDGHVALRRHMNAPIFDGGKIVGVAGVGNKEAEYNESDVQQVSLLMQGMWRLIERKQAEAALQESEKKFRRVVQNAPMGMHMYELEDDGTLRFVGANPAADKMLGIDNAQYIGKPIEEAFPVIEKTDVPAKFREIARTGGFWHNENIEYQDDQIAGAFETYNFQFAPGRMVSLFIDITDRKRMEAQIQQFQRMEAIGSLAGGIAHDFNNILFPIVGMAEMLLEDLPEDSLEHENTHEILKAGKRGSDLVQQILTFSRQTEQKKIPARIQQVLQEVLKLSRASIPTNIEIRQDIKPDCGLVMADPTQVHQIAMNLITNAYHAVGASGGHITIKLKEVVCNQVNLPDPVLEPGNYAVLSVSDTGCGIEPAVMDKIFEPYFTTKEQGRGTGLGLATAYGIVKDHGGEIRVDSEIGKGTTFDVYLPLMAGEKARALSKTEAADPSGTERILLVDDEPTVAGVEKLMLERLGYQVTERTSSTEALRAFAANQSSFDLVVTDMNMPEMTGDILARKLIEIRPDIPVVLCTGFSERINKEKAEAIGIKGFLMKPIVKSEMAQVVRKVLDERKEKIYR